MSECQSDRGEWGEICPDCGKRLPAAQGSLTSWQAARDDNLVETTRRGRTRTAGERMRWQKASAAKRRVTIEQVKQFQEVLTRHGGNRAAAARELGLGPTYVYALARRASSMGLKVPPPLRPRPEVARRAKCASR